MTAARLEELAVWAQSQADWCAGQDLPHDIGGKYADLARCARGWAKLQEIGDKWWYVDHFEQALFFGQGLHDSCDRHHTAIEAVEATGGPA